MDAAAMDPLVPEEHQEPENQAQAATDRGSLSPGSAAAAAEQTSRELAELVKSKVESALTEAIAKSNPGPQMSPASRTASKAMKDAQARRAENHDQGLEVWLGLSQLFWHTDWPEHLAHMCAFLRNQVNLKLSTTQRDDSPDVVCGSRYDHTDNGIGTFRSSTTAFAAKKALSPPEWTRAVYFVMFWLSIYTISACFLTFTLVERFILPDRYNITDVSTSVDNATWTEAVLSGASPPTWEKEPLVLALVPAALGAWLILFTVLKVTHPITGELMAVISAEPLSAEDHLYVVLCFQCVAMAPRLTTTRRWLGGRYLKRWRIFTVTVAVVITLLYLINFIFGVLFLSKDLFADRPAFNGECACGDEPSHCYVNEWKDTKRGAYEEWWGGWTCSWLARVSVSAEFLGYSLGAGPPLYAFVYTLIAASTVGFSGATRVHKRIEEEDRTPGGAARAIDEIGEEIATLEEEVLRPLGDGWGLALSWLVAVLLFAVLLYVPSMTKENEGRIGRIFLSVVFCSVALMVLTPVVMATTVYEQLVDDLNELRTEGSGSGVGFVPPDVDAKISVIINYMQALNKRKGPGVAVLGIVMNTKELGVYAAQFWATSTILLPMIGEYNAVFKGLLTVDDLHEQVIRLAIGDEKCSPNATVVAAIADVLEEHMPACQYIAASWLTDGIPKV